MSAWPINPTWEDPAQINSGNEFEAYQGLINTDLSKIVTNLIWVKNNRTIPIGGSEGQVLTRYGIDQLLWKNVEGLPSGGNEGQILRIGENGIKEWTDEQSLEAYATTAYVTQNYFTKQDISTNYYNKDSIDDLLEDKADAEDVYTKDAVYSKTEINNNYATITIVNEKADADDVYTKTEALAQFVTQQYLTTNYYNTTTINAALNAKADATDVYDKDSIDDLLANKQSTLVSGQDIKTLNGESLLGSGNIPFATSLGEDSDRTATVTAIRAFVNSSINSVAAYYLTADAQGNAFATRSALTNATVFYSGGSTRTPTQNDYCIVTHDESQGTAYSGYTSFTSTDNYIGYYVIYNRVGYLVTNDNKNSLGINPGTTVAYVTLPTTRYSYQNNAWSFQYTINIAPFTAAQLTAVNSGIDATKVQQILNNTNNITAVQQALSGKQATISDLETIRSGATAGSTAVQPSDLADYSTTSEMNQAISNATSGKANSSDVYTKTAADNKFATLAGLLDFFYPVGTIYETTSENLNTTAKMAQHFGGTWEYYGTGEVIVGYASDDDLFGTVGNNGGSRDAIIPTHTHSASIPTADGSHKHVLRFPGVTTSYSMRNTYPISDSKATVAIYQRGNSDTYAANHFTLPSNTSGYANEYRGYSLPGTLETSDATLPSVDPGASEHTHSITVASATDGVAVTNKNLQPYRVVYRYRRTA